MDDSTPFRANILDNLADDDPKLVYADWLEEHGCPVEAHALRWCVKHGKWPKKEAFQDWHSGGHDGWSWVDSFWGEVGGDRLPRIVYDIMPTRDWMPEPWPLIADLGVALTKIRAMVDAWVALK